MCNSFFRWVHSTDKYNNFLFTNFQSDYIKKNMHLLGDAESIAVIKADKTILRKVEAVSYILKTNKSFLILRIFINLFPYFISNTVYDQIAKVRYIIFGKYDQCPILDKKYKKKFLG